MDEFKNAFPKWDELLFVFLLTLLAFIAIFAWMKYIEATDEIKLLEYRCEFYG